MTSPPTYTPGDRVRVTDADELRAIASPAPDVETGDTGEVTEIDAGPEPSVGIFGYTYKVKIDRTDAVEILPGNVLTAAP